MGKRKVEHAVQDAAQANERRLGTCCVEVLEMLRWSVM
jgi:hypothetical protein